MGEVITLGCITTLDLPPERILEGALKANLKTVLVLGYKEDGSTYFASSQADGGDVMWLMEKAKSDLLKIEL